MKYGIWFVRLLFAAWMIPAGLNHFVPIFPQPMGNQPLSMELIVALLDSHLFDLVKGVELIAGLGVLFGIFTPLSLLICLPVSFGVFYWDAPLEGWTSGAARYGYATLFCNAILCLAYYKSYQSIFTLRTEVTERVQPVMIGRIVLGLAAVLFAVNILFISGAPQSTQPLAAQLMSSLDNSRLLQVASIMQILAGVLLLAGMLVPLALTILMIITSNGLFWAVFLNQTPLLAVLSLAMFAVNGLLMLAYLPCFKGTLERFSMAAGEEHSSSYDNLFVSPYGTTGKADFIPALITVLAAMAFFGYFVPGRTADFCMLVLTYPLFILLIRRVRDMGRNPWVVSVPLLFVLIAFDVQLGYFTLEETGDGLIGWLAVLMTAVFVGWGLAGNSNQETSITS